MDRTGRIAVFFVILGAIYYCWSSYVLPVRSDEAYLYLKSMGLSWTTVAPTGLIEYIIKGMNFFGSSPMQLRLPSVVFVSLSALIIYNISLKLSGVYSAWVSMILFAVVPAVTYSYSSITPNAVFIFCFAIYSYAFSMIAILHNKSVKYYIWLLISVICAMSIDFSGILLLINHILCGFIKKDMLSDKKYNIISVVSILFLIIFAVSHYAGIFDLFYKYPVTSKNSLIYVYLLFAVIYLPVLFTFFAALWNKQIENNMKPLFISSVIFAVGGIIFSIIGNYDVRFLGALIIPAVILSGWFYEAYGYKITVGAMVIILVSVSVYTDINDKSSLTPSYIGSSKVYEYTRPSIQNVLPSYNSCIFSREPELSSIISYNTFTRPEACTIQECKNTSGVFVSEEKDESLYKYFSKVKEVNIYRHRSIKDGEFTLYFYEVEGLKENRQ